MEILFGTRKPRYRRKAEDGLFYLSDERRSAENRRRPVVVDFHTERNVQKGDIREGAIIEALSEVVWPAAREAGDWETMNLVERFLGWRKTPRGSVVLSGKPTTVYITTMGERR